ncbi:MAG: type II secretion system protein [Geothrix sp.]|uniref:Type II secretion system protein n=1 Tax=Candidatus Geothrix odensensis TaxID=2954440 RepID=A0A936F4J1_9BACT|nr:type II secretion system protein [Candidatus Geothrix odensensis]MCC6512523.1 type II secretion system protein [Geothrix sp.]
MTTSSRSQRGFTMALALALAVVMGIMLMKAGPLVSAEVQRENEAELIFRGEAIAHAFRLYASKAGRYPMDLDEVMKVRPRILRQKYKDPMTPGGDWEFITQVRPGASGNTDGLPIVGVRSKSSANSIRMYQNKTLVRDWQFTAEQNLLGITDGIGKSRGSLKAGGATDKPQAPKE